MVAPFSAGPTVYVDILPDASKFGGALKRDMMAHTSGLKRQSEQLSKSFTTSFTSIGKSIQSATSHLGIFGKTNSRVAESTIQAQHGVERATMQRERASIELAQAEQGLVRVQSRASASAQELALAQLRVRSASLTAASASSRYDDSIKRLGRSSDDTKRSFSNLVPSIGNANASLSLASRSAGMFGGAMNLIKWPALIQGANLAAAALSSLSAAAVGAIASLAPLGGLLATIPAGIAAVGSAVGTAALGFFGIGDALTAMGEQATASIPAMGGAGGAAQDAGRAAADAGRAVVAAQRGVADANRAVQDSERSLADAQRQVQFAQESLTDAREDARQTLRDLRDEVEGNALSEEQAKLRVLQARQALREMQKDDNATRLDVRQAILDVEQAEFDLAQTREENRENQRALNEAERAGISGSEQVIAARRGVADANRGVEDAERALADAHRGVEEAQRAVAEAQRGVTEALQAGSGATTAATSEATALTEAMAALSPAGREFVRVLFNMKPKLDELRATAQKGLLPGLGRAIQTLGRELFPLLNRVVKETAGTLGDLAEEGANLVTSGPWKRDFATLLSGNSRLLNNMGHIAFNLADAFRHIAIAGQPLAFWLGRVAEKGSQAISDFFEKARRSGDMAAFFEDTKEAAKRLFSILGNLGTILVDVLEAGQPLGRWLLRQFDELTEGWADFTSSMEGQNALKKWFNSAKPVLRELGALIGDVAKLFGEMATRGGLPQLIRQIRTRLLPVFGEILRTSSGKLIPALVELTRQFGKLFKVFGTEHGFVLKFIDSLTTILRVVTKLLDTAPALKSLVAGLGSLAGIVAAVKLAGFITGFSAVKNLLGGVGGSAVVATDKVSLLAKAVGALGGKGAAAGAAATAGVSGGLVSAGIVALGAIFVALGVKTAEMNQKVRDAVETVRKYGRESKEGAKASKNFADAQGGVTRAIRGNVAVFKNQNEELDAANAAFKKQQRELLGSEQATKDYNAVVKDANDISQAQKEKIAAVLGGLNQLGGGLTETERLTTNNLLKVGDYRGALDNLRDALERVTDKHANQSDKLRGTQNELGAAKRAADRYRGSLNGIPLRKKTKVETDTKNATEKIMDFIAAVESIPGSTTTIVKMAKGDGFGKAGILASLGTGKGTAAKMARQAMAAIPGAQGVTGYRSPEENAAVGGALNSYHMDPVNPAQDISGPNLLAVAQWLVGHFGATAREIIHTPLGFSISHGARVPPIAAADHYDHVHVADNGGVFKGPGMVQIGNLKELVFQPAEKMSDLPRRDETIAPLIKQLVKLVTFSRQDKSKEGPAAQGGVTARPAQGNVAVFKNQNKVLNETNKVFEKQQREVLDSSKITKDYSKVINDTNDISVQQKEKIAVVIGGLRQLGGELQVSQRHTISNHLRTEDYKGGLELLHNAIDRVTGKSRDQAGILSKVEERFKQIRAKADSYRQTLNGIPRRKDTEADAKTRDATKKINDYLKKLEEVPGQISTTASVKMGQGTGLSLAKIAPGGKAGSAAAMAGAAMNAVRGTQVISSGYRPGDDGYHGDASNPAQDISGAQTNGVFIYGQSIYNYLIKTFGQNIREMIWAHDRWEDGQHNYWAASDHFDHVHVADKGGVFRGPGLVRLGDTEETIFEPAKKMSELPHQETTNNKKMEVHLHGDFKRPADYARELDWYARTRPW